MGDFGITVLLIVALFLLLGTGVWIGLTLLGVAWIGMELFTTRPAGDAMAVTIWGTASSWTLTALPLFVWMGEILFRTRLSEDMFRGLPPLPGGQGGRDSGRRRLAPPPHLAVDHHDRLRRHRRGVDRAALHRR